MQSQGTSFASALSGAGDISTALFNPAALFTVQDREASGSLTLVLPAIEGDVIGFDQTVRPGVAALVPSGVIAARISDSVVLGLGVHSPFGLTTQYENDFIGVGDALLSELLTVSVTPMASWSPASNFSVGAGFSIIYSDPQLTRAVGIDANGGILEAELNATEVSFAGSAGFLWDVTNGTRIGVAATTGYDIDTSGILDAFDPTGAPVSLTGDAQISLPATVAVGVSHELSPAWTLHGQVEWADWSVFDEIAVNVPALGPGANLSEATNYQDSLFIALGAEYAWDDALTLRAGMAYDQTPTTRFDRSVRIPDTDRIWASVGASHDFGEAMTMHAGYRAIFFPDSTATLKNGAAAGTEVKYNGVAHLFSIGGSIRF